MGVRVPRRSTGWLLVLVGSTQCADGCKQNLCLIAPGWWTGDYVCGCCAQHWVCLRVAVCALRPRKHHATRRGLTTLPDPLGHTRVCSVVLCFGMMPTVACPATSPLGQVQCLQRRCVVRGRYKGWQAQMPCALCAAAAMLWYVTYLPYGGA